MAGIPLSSSTIRREADVIPIKRIARRGAICSMLTLKKRGLDLDEERIHVSSLSFFSTPVLIRDRKLEGQQVRIRSMHPLIS
jgi:hypothetical protein